MIAWKSWGGLVMTFLFAAAGSHVVADMIASHVSQKVIMGHVSRSCPHSLPQKKDAAPARVTILKMTYGPGERSIPRGHACPITSQTTGNPTHPQMKAKAEKSEKAGIRSKEQAQLPTFFLCDHAAAPQANTNGSKNS